MASATEDPSKQFIESLDKLKVPEASNTYNITGMSAAHVIAIFKSLVNRKGRRGYRTGKVFTFNICREDQPTISFQLIANPKRYQPGNGVIYRTGQRNDAYLYNGEFVRQLKEKYPTSTKEFAQHIKRVFKNNSELLKCENNTIIQHVYFLLLFEIGRRLGDDMIVKEKYREGKQAFDSLPISEAITMIVKLFENEECRFEDVFLKEGKYHCFTGPDPGIRKNAIEKLNLKDVQFEDIKELFVKRTKNHPKILQAEMKNHPKMLQAKAKNHPMMPNFENYPESSASYKFYRKKSRRNRRTRIKWQRHQGSRKK
ncbi:uncharacterized protein LOC114956488 [Acropora millepora]|uniref:uncharacterized protein LOC114956488 n=1 Tax=Acropora millepora TaxID=45264 RepID=UPI001CF57B4F|nr:uncharacterized protein LOC114956488 [Acropora millepora]